MKAEEVIRLLDLKPLEMEGGYFRRTYENMDGVTNGKPRATSIYYLLTADTCSCLHRLPSDEVYHFYLGDPVELLVLDDLGQGSVHMLGGDLAAEMRVQAVVPAHFWQGSRLVAGGSWALLGTTMAPGFNDEDFTAMSPEIAQKLSEIRPDLKNLILALQKE